jgi:hypothetical protein
MKGEKKEISLETFGRSKTFIWSVDERNGGKSIYFVCDFSRSWLKMVKGFEFLKLFQCSIKCGK